MKRGEAGVTLIELLVAVTLLSLLSLGMVMALRIGLAAYSKTEAKLMDDRRVAGAQRVLQSELEGLVPAFVNCGANGQGGTGQSAVLFEGAQGGLWMVSTYSLEAGWRGRPQILQIFVIAGQEGERLVVNEFPYTGAMGAAPYCGGSFSPPNTISRLAVMIPAAAGPNSFVLADKLSFARFSYLAPGNTQGDPPGWRPSWATKGWPLAIRIEMQPLAADPSTIQPITVTAPIHVRRDPEKVYTDPEKVFPYDR